MKIKLDDILKNGENFKARKIDVNDPEYIQMVKAIKNEQKKALARKKVDWNKLNKRVG